MQTTRSTPTRSTPTARAIALMGLILLGVGALAPSPADGQVLRLVPRDSARPDIAAAPGDTLTIDVVADLGGQSAAGLRFFVRLPRHEFEILGRATPPGSLSGGMMPFQPGALFEDALQVRNDLLAADAPAADGWRMMEYAAILGPRADRTRSGTGVVASFQLVCPLVPTSCTVAVHQDPIHESRLVLPDGVTEKPFLLGAPLIIDVDRETAVPGTSWGEVKIQVR